MLAGCATRTNEGAIANSHLDIKERTIMPYNFTPAQQAGLAGQVPLGGWSAIAQAHTTQSWPKTYQGVNYILYRAAGESAVHFAFKKARLKEAIGRLQQAGIMFQNADVHRFHVICYNHFSRGVVCFEAAPAGGLNALPTVVLMLGGRVCEHVTTQAVPPPVIAGGASNPPRILSDRFYDYYRGTYVSEEARCGLAQVFHEFGHIFYQLQRPKDYLLGTDVGYKAMIPLATQEARDRDLLLPNTSNQARTYVSQYADDGDRALIEYVSEVFCGWMMGVDWNLVDPTYGATNAYLALGGPTFPNLPATITRLNAFINQQCNCPGHGQGAWGHAAKITW
jgi:hypothetical protein